jgi:hypothetical protein
VNRPFIGKRASRTNHKDALVAEPQIRTVKEMAGEAITAVLPGKCTQQYALLAGEKPKFPLGLLLIGLYIARTASSQKNVAETDINSALTPAETGGGNCFLPRYWFRALTLS